MASQQTTALAPLEALDVTKLPNPEAVLDYYSIAARALKRVISSQELKPGEKNRFMTKIEGKEYLGFESWQTIARFNGCHVETESVEPIYSMDGEKIVGYEAWALLIHDATGMRLGRAPMECGMDAFPVKSRQGRDAHKAAKSAAQTWAGSKVCRMVFGFVAVLAGFQATTAEEMAHESQDAGADDERSASDAETWGTCPLHDVPFFKTDKMRNRAHKIEGTDPVEWCDFRPGLWAAETKLLAGKLGWDNKAVGELSKEMNQGKTWSRLNYGEVMGVLNHMRKRVEAIAVEESAPPAAAPPEAEGHSEKASEAEAEAIADDDEAAGAAAAAEAGGETQGALGEEPQPPTG